MRFLPFALFLLLVSLPFSCAPPAALRTEVFSVRPHDPSARDPENAAFLITGKLWPELFEVRFVPP
jgi:glutamine cyclotransferase